MTTQKTCPDCGTEVGHTHNNQCDVERCSVCGQQRITCECEAHDPMNSVWTGEWTMPKPSFLGVAILARHDPSGHFSKENCYFRTAVSAEEARQGIELHVGADLRERILDLERQGWFQLTEEKRQELMQLGGACQ